MIRYSLLFLFFCFFFFSSSAQDKYLVFLTDKAGTSFDPYEYFDAKAIERKQKANISINDSTDFPLNEAYVTTISNISTEFIGVSRWFNAVICRALPNELATIEALPFVHHSELLASEAIVSSYEPVLTSEKLMTTLRGQTKTLGHPRFKKANYQGEGMRIAIFDVGFNAANVIEELQHVFANNQVIEGYDFVKKHALKYSKGGSHGTMVMSCIAGIHQSQNMGLAPNAEFLLARTERQITEFGSEEENWLLAAEWADKNGADLINSSLGYTSQRYYQHDMQGSTALVTRAATFAASKGMLVINSAGNEGSSTWKTIGAPADADSVLTIGGIQPSLGYHASWSSYGPTADLRRKPNVCAYGDAAVASRNSVSINSGTSFSAPLITGFAACAWQANPDFTNMQLFEAIEKSANLYPYYDYVHGYGLPQAGYFTDPDYNSEQVEPTFTYHLEKNKLLIQIIPEELSSMADDIMEGGTTSPPLRLPNRQVYEVPDYVYLHIENDAGVLDRYQIIQPDGINGGMINIAPLIGKTIRIYYKNFIEEFYVE